MPHLLKDTSGHLALHSSGHLKLPPTTYTLTVDSYLWWRGYSGVLYYADYASQAAAVIAAIEDAVTNLAYYYDASTWGNAAITSDTRSTSTFAYAHARGRIYELVPDDGASFDSPVIPQLDITKGGGGWSGQDGSEGYVRVGTGSSKPTGNPASWNDNVHSGGTTTLYDVAASKYLWISCDLNSWAGWSHNLYSDGKGVGGELSVTGTISD